MPIFDTERTKTWDEEDRMCIKHVLEAVHVVFWCYTLPLFAVHLLSLKIKTKSKTHKQVVFTWQSGQKSERVDWLEMEWDQ